MAQSQQKIEKGAQRANCGIRFKASPNTKAHSNQLYGASAYRCEKSSPEGKADNSHKEQYSHISQPNKQTG